jgi:hypothetical protein
MNESVNDGQLCFNLQVHMKKQEKGRKELKYHQSQNQRMHITYRVIVW